MSVRVRSFVVILVALMLIGLPVQPISATDWRPGDAKEPLVARNGIVVAGHPLAAEAGLQILRKGGNAIDAAVATAAALSVTLSHMTGPLGSGYAVIYTARDGKVTVADFNGQAPMAARAEELTREELRRGIKAMTIPGNLKGWDELLQRYGTMTLAEVFAPAITLAEKGFPMDYTNVSSYNRFLSELIIYPTWYDTFFYHGREWQPGDIFVYKNMAKTLRRIANEGVETVYGGDLGRELVEFVQANGGLWTLEDLANYEVQWKEPIHITYRGLDVYGAPPTSSAITWMQTLKILEGFDLSSMEHNSAEYLHLLIEASKRAHLDGYRYVGDPNFVDVPVDMLLSEEHAAKHRASIEPGKALQPQVYAQAHWPDIGHSTTHMIVIDAYGNVVSMTNTHGAFWGSGVVLGDTGLLGSNGMDWFDLDVSPWTGERSATVLEPGKRNRWTLSPGIILKDGRPYIVVGGAGAEATMQGIVQPLVNLIDFGMNPADALGAPRFRWGDVYHYTGGTQVRLQHLIPDEVREKLKAWGHDIVERELEPRPPTMGTTQLVQINQETGALFGAASHQMGYVMGY